MKASPVTLFDPDPEAKLSLLLSMEATLAGRGIKLLTCCEKQVVDRLPETSRVNSGGCIDGRRLVKVHGPGISLRRDRGQRTKSGCQCSVAVDIGDYRLHRCRHNCLYCYGQPAAVGSAGLQN